MLGWLCFTAASFTVALLVRRALRIGHREDGLPPGPPTTPFFGNAREFPRELAHLRYTEWADSYGQIFSLKMLHQTVVVLSSATSVREVLDKQGRMTGNRPQSILVERTMGPTYHILHDLDIHTWKTTRKVMHSMLLSPEAIHGYWITQQTASLKLLRNTLKDPEHILSHVKLSLAAPMFSLVYGHNIDEFIGSKAELFYKCAALAALALDLLTHPPVDLLPVLQYVPSRWARWKTLSCEAKRLRDLVDLDLFRKCEEAVQHGDNRTGCYIEQALQRQLELDMSSEEIRSMGTASLDAGIETVASALQASSLP